MSRVKHDDFASTESWTILTHNKLDSVSRPFFDRDYICFPLSQNFRFSLLKNANDIHKSNRSFLWQTDNLWRYSNSHSNRSEQKLFSICCLLAYHCAIMLQVFFYLPGQWDYKLEQIEKKKSFLLTWKVCGISKPKLLAYEKCPSLIEGGQRRQAK